MATLAGTVTGVRPRRTTRVPLTFVVTLVPVAAALNIVGAYIVSILHLPVFLDMIGTAVVAITLGPWWGALVGIITNFGEALLTGPVGLPFALCNVVGAIFWGYGVRSWGLGRTFPRFFVLNCIVALMVSLTAVPIYVFIFGGATGAFSDMLTAAFLAMGQNLWVSVFSSNILVSLADKILSGFVAVAIIEALPSSLTADLPIIKAAPMRIVLYAIFGIVVAFALVLVSLALAK